MQGLNAYLDSIAQAGDEDDADDAEAEAKERA
jgi:hypothetical protein